jgi:transposase
MVTGGTGQGEQEDSMKAWVGIDVAKAQLQVALKIEGRAQELEAVFDNTPAGFAKLDHWLQRHAKLQPQVCLEATGIYGEDVAEYLVAHGYRVSVVNPLRIKGYAHSQLSRTKTDPVDARLIADFCRTQQPEAWTPPPAEWCELRAMVRHLDDLELTRQQTANRLGNGSSSPLVVTHLQDQLSLLAQHIEQTKRQIQDHIDRHPGLKQQKELLTSIPGIGELTAGKLLAECRDLTAFDDVRQVVAFAGLNPRQRRSGSSVRGRSAISKCGNAALRAALYMPALVARRFNPLLHAFAERLKLRGLTAKAVIVAVMRKLLHLAYGVLKSGQPFDPHWLTPTA